MSQTLLIAAGALQGGGMLWAYLATRQLNLPAWLRAVYMVFWPVVLLVLWFASTAGSRE